MSQTLAISSADLGTTINNGVMKYKVVNIVSGFADNAKPLLVGCRSNDNDLGEHTLWKGQEFRFLSGISGVKTTQIICYFEWGSNKLEDITVFKNDEYFDPCAIRPDICFWKAAEDGLYSSNNDQNWVKRFDWQ
ncbi:Plant self-incompatibility S1 [Corchorus olitorius]|uniref:S-protein homolog n=1 Tax=Corchorus olitorius TaxID=93759 RepID=A0A1R3KPZ6_9ROSI|nr:Plant self-incompatibility S1 [Corchorus olitorius]